MQTDIATRAMVVTLMAPGGGAKTTSEIHTLTGLPIRTIRKIYARAIRRGFEPNQRPIRLIDAWLEDAPRPLQRVKYTGDLIVSKEMIEFFGSGETAANITGERMDIGTIVKTQSTTKQDSTSTESDWEDEEE
ncbi:uncharacterized protein BKA55DRAFT_698258 [Fusarium redolens]|uniref:Uncharacterized protein n=1 Tax=Fusarium redolens TaxID=48865 RepID=A0A9P9JKC2_FUSRE|nr:uncharacterized protein BKA55DRAFT_698258 [Fusarium redolens]KAH7207872.1 hypothetical protein BKA55DRAFT_698258 [Fusarium redolens]